MNYFNHMHDMGIIFDFDQTLVDTKFIEPYRKNRDWATVRKLVPQVRAYNGINHLMKALIKNNIPIAIVTNSPGFYLDLILNHLGWSVPYKVCFHDVPKGHHKPHPFPIQKAVRGLGLETSLTYSFGDRDIDITASKEAKVKAIGCLWGCDDSHSLLQAKPDILLSTPEELCSYLAKEFSLLF